MLGTGSPWGDEMVWNWIEVVEAPHLNVPNAVKWFMFKPLLLCYVNFISTFKQFKWIKCK